MDRFNPRDPETWISRELFAAYCGGRSEKLLAYYDKAKAKRTPIVFSFDWLAILLLPAWLGYRRQWTLWSTLVGAVALVTLVTERAHIDLPAGAFTGGLLALGAAAPGLLLTQANGLYLKLSRQGLSEDAIRAALADKASPHVGFALLGLIAALAVQALVVLVP